MGCAGRVANGTSTVHLSYVREKTGHALVGARQWILSEDIADPVKSLRGHRRPVAGTHRQPGRRPPGPPTGRPQTPGWSRCLSARSSTCSPPPSATRSRPATAPGGSSTDAATRHYPAGSTNAHAWNATTPWSASNCRLPY
jgi:hypothetical protein